MRYLKLWALLAVVILGSFAVLGYYGVKIYREAPPIPKQVVTTGGAVVCTEQDIQNGKNVWQSIGGQEVGSIWGHGAYVAPDWNGDWLHRECLFLLDRWAKAEFGQPYEQITESQQASLKPRLKNELSTNTYNPDTGGRGAPFPSYEVVNAFVEYVPDAMPHLTLRGEVNNLFDAAYVSRATYGQEFANVAPLQEPGRSFKLSLTGRF